MLLAFSTSANRTRTFRLLALCVVLVLTAAIMGIGDNPVGIGLVFLATIALVLAFVHPWQSPRQYVLLLCASVLALAVSVVLHNMLEDLTGNLDGSTLSGRLLVGAGGALLFIAICLCPVGIVIGAIGALVRWAEKL